MVCPQRAFSDVRSGTFSGRGGSEIPEIRLLLDLTCMGESPRQLICCQDFGNSLL